MGGEEFLLVVKDTSEQEALAVAARLVEVWRDTDPLVTISAGVAIHHSEQQPSATYAHADTALYAAKEHGRDRAELAVRRPASFSVIRD